MTLEEVRQRKRPTKQEIINNINEMAKNYPINLEKLKQKHEKGLIEKRKVMERLNYENECKIHNFKQILIKMEKDPEYHEMKKQELPHILNLWLKNGIPNGMYLRDWLNILNNDFNIKNDNFLFLQEYLKQTINELDLPKNFNYGTVALNYFNENEKSPTYPIMGMISSSPFKDKY